MIQFVRRDADYWRNREKKGKPGSIFCLMVLLVLNGHPQYIFSQSSNITLTLRQSGTSRALVIGISDCLNLSEDLSYAAQDAEAFKDYLVSKADLVPDSTNVRLLLNEEASAGGIIEGLDWLLSRSDSNDRAYIFFSGHGDTEQKTSLKRSYLLAANANSGGYYLSSISVSVLKDYLFSFQEKHVKVFLIIDACRPGNLAGGIEGAEAMAFTLKEDWQNEIKILSTQPGHLSYEDPGLGHGVFTHYLLRGLEGESDLDADRAVTIYELMKYLQEHVRAATANQQTPISSGDLNEVFVNNYNQLAKIQSTNQNPDERIELPTNLKFVDTLDMKAVWNTSIDLDTLRTAILIQLFFDALKKGELLPMTSDKCADCILERLSKRADAQKILQRLRNMLFGKIIDEGGKALGSYFDLGGEARSEINAGNALELMAYAKDRYPNHIIIARLTVCYNFFLGLRTDSLNYLQKTIDQDSSFMYGFYALGDWHERSGNFEEASFYFGKALNLSPTWGEAQLAFAEVQNDDHLMGMFWWWIFFMLILNSLLFSVFIIRRYQREKMIFNFVLVVLNILVMILFISSYNGLDLNSWWGLGISLSLITILGYYILRRE